MSPLEISSPRSAGKRSKSRVSNGSYASYPKRRPFGKLRAGKPPALHMSATQYHKGAVTSSIEYPVSAVRQGYA